MQKQLAVVMRKCEYAKDTLRGQKTRSMKLPKRRLVHTNEPPPAPKVVPLRKLAAAHVLEAVIVSPKFWGFETHWEGAKTLPHFEEEQLCHGCRQQMPRRWKGFLLLWCFMTKQKYWFEFTPGAARMMQAQRGGQSFRGCIVRVRRERPRDKAPMIAEVWLPDVPREGLPPDESPIPTLETLWGIPGQLS